MLMFCRAYFDHESGMSEAERSQLDKFYEKCVSWSGCTCNWLRFC